jgi:hypothetical protein
MYLKNKFIRQLVSNRVVLSIFHFLKPDRIVTEAYGNAQTTGTYIMHVITPMLIFHYIRHVSPPFWGGAAESTMTELNTGLSYQPRMMTDVD